MEKVHGLMDRVHDAVLWVYNTYIKWWPLNSWSMIEILFHEGLFSNVISVVEYEVDDWDLKSQRVSILLIWAIGFNLGNYNFLGDFYSYTGGVRWRTHLGVPRAVVVVVGVTGARRVTASSFTWASTTTEARYGGRRMPVLGQMATVRRPEAQCGVGFTQEVMHRRDSIGKRKLGFDKENVEIEHVEGPIYRVFGSMSCATRSRTQLYL
jgi:hypothetical protein